MKKIISLFLTVMLMTACLSVPAMAEEGTEISVLLDGDYVSFDVEPVIVDGRTMVPVRAIFEALGATVDWQQETQTVVSNKGDTNIALKINDTTLYKNGEAVTLDVPAQLIENRTLVPVRAISEAYGCYVDWNNWTKTVLIISDLDTVPVATVNGEAISAGYYHFYLAQMETNAMQNMGLQPEDLQASWASDVGGISFGMYICDVALEQCVYIKSNAQKAKAEGIELTETDMMAVDDTVENLLGFYVLGDQTKQQESHLQELGFTLNAIKEFYTDNMYAEKYATALVENVMSDEEAKQYLDENYVKAKHILISTMDAETGASLSEEDAAAKKKLAEQLLVKIRNGANFDELIKEYGEDPGMEQSPDGYLFTDGEMITEFEVAVKNLNVGETSGIVESMYGYHIIKRVANGEYTVNEIEQIKNNIASQALYETLGGNMQASQVMVNDVMISQMVPMSI